MKDIQYVRYADDFLIGVVGNLKYARQIRKDINIFIKGNLHFDVKKANLIHRDYKSTLFLGHIISLSEFKAKISTKPKQIRAAKKNKNKSVSKFLEFDKRLAKTKSYQLYSTVLSQFSVLSNKLKISIKNKGHIESIAFVLAYRSIGSVIMKELSLSDWNQFFELLFLADPSKFSLKENNNPAIKR